MAGYTEVLTWCAGGRACGGGRHRGRGDGQCQRRVRAAQLLTAHAARALLHPPTHPLTHPTRARRALCSHAEVFASMRLEEPPEGGAVAVGNPATAEFEVCRTSLLPSVRGPRARAAA